MREELRKSGQKTNSREELAGKERGSRGGERERVKASVEPVNEVQALHPTSQQILGILILNGDGLEKSEERPEEIQNSNNGIGSNLARVRVGGRIGGKGLAKSPG